MSIFNCSPIIRSPSSIWAPALGSMSVAMPRIVSTNLAASNFATPATVAVCGIAAKAASEIGAGSRSVSSPGAGGGDEDLVGPVLAVKAAGPDEPLQPGQPARLPDARQHLLGLAVALLV